MATEQYDIICWWENRAETAEACAARFAKMVDGLAGIDEVFRGWRKLGKTRASAQEPFCKTPADVAELAQIFDQNRAHYDSPKRVWPELGFSFGCWNGLDPPFETGMHVDAGAYANDRRTPNSVVIQASDHSKARSAAWTASELRTALNVMIDAWDAREAAVLSIRYLDMAPTGPPKKPGWPEVPLSPLVGWITFIPKPQTMLITPPAGISVEHTDRGDLYTLCEEPFNVDDPNHRARAAAMEEALRPIRY